MKIKPTSNKRNIRSKKPSTLKKEPWEVDFRIGCMITGVKTADLLPQHFEFLSSLLLLWSDRPEALDIKEFLNYQVILYRNIEQYTSKSELFAETYHIAMQRIARNREQNALKHNPEGIAFKNMQSLYDEEWAKREERQATIRNKTEDGKTPTHVSILSLEALKELSSGTDKSGKRGTKDDS